MENSINDSIIQHCQEVPLSTPPPLSADEKAKAEAEAKEKATTEAKAKREAEAKAPRTVLNITFQKKSKI